jgi:hypothetical protein
MDQIELKNEEILEAMNQEFPKELTIVIQRLHIKKLEERIREAEEFNLVVKETNGS